uniref:Protein kinase domain-containing protein n=1 Tax=Dicentrarchus labrax TaxID=13489 RepID=A0A8P4K1C8_DICLA
MSLNETAGTFHYPSVESFLGEGGFGFVTKCHNLVTDEMEAIKVNKNLPSVFHQARAEIAILKRLQCLDPDTCNIVKWNGYFFDRDHICLNFELLDQSLYSYMVGRDFRGLSMAELRPILFQLATTLSHLRSMDIVHADLKPDNVMLVDSKKQPLKVKLIDFGLARPVSAVEPGVCVQTTWYRAPEVMLHLPFDEAIDMWSLGLVAAELATGSPLYPGDTDYDVLRFILETQGQPADDVLDRGMGTEYYFREQRHGQQRWIDHQTEQRLLVDLIKRMLELDPEQRIKPPGGSAASFLCPEPSSEGPHLCPDVRRGTTNTEPAVFRVQEKNRLPGCISEFCVVFCCVIFCHGKI